MNRTELIVSEYKKVIADRKNDCIKKSVEFNADNRGDEANLEKIKANIYDVFTAMLNASQKKAYARKDCDQDTVFEGFCEEYLKTFDNIPKSWIDRLENAKKHNDYATQVIEETKLNVAEEIKQEFIRLKEVQ